ncbi:MAG: hypothetical protein JXL80_03915 [Planctomycetes bacterium]|nr:hypothetical protein [Planctomycetota bacterium]
MPLINMHWLAIVGGLLAAMFLLLVPAIIRTGRKPSRSARAVLRLADALAFPARLLSVLHTGDVRMHVLWTVIGTVLLCVAAGNLPWPDMPPLTTAPIAARATAQSDHVEIVAAWPQLALVAAAVLGLLAKVVLGRRAFWPTLVLVLAGLVTAGATLVQLYDPLSSEWHDMMGLMRLDPFAVFGQLALLAVSAVMVAASLFEIRRMGDRRADFLVTLILAATGATIAVSATDLLTLYTGLALMMLCNTILLGMQSHDASATEAAMKHFLAGMVAFALLLFGVALVYAASGDTQYDGVAEGLTRLVAAGQGPIGLASAGLALVLAGMALLVGLVPFHMHVPDTYQGAPAPSVGFLVSVPTMAAVLVLVRLLKGPFAVVVDVARPIVLVLGIVSLVGGALLATVQSDPRRTVGHLAACLVGITLILIAGTGMVGIEQQTEYVQEAFALALLLTTMLFALCGVATAALCDVDLDAPATDRRTAVRRTVASGPTFILALACLALAAVVLYMGGPGGKIELPSIARSMVVAALVLAASRFTILFWRLSQKTSASVPMSAKVIAAAILLGLVAAAGAGALCAGHIINAVTAMWP